jgi:Flp pilus assembly protein TadD
MTGERPLSQDSINAALQSFQAGDQTSARSILTALLEKEPANAAAHNLLGLVLMKQKQFPLAKQEFEVAVHLQPDSAANHTNLGNALVQLRRDQDAKQEYQRSLALNPQDGPALENLGLLEARARNYREATDYLARARLLKPKDLTVLAALAASLISDKQFSDAESLIPELLQAGEGTETSRYSLALLSLESGEPELGSKFMLGDQKGQMAFQIAALERAETLSAAKQYKEALRVLAAARTLGPQTGEFHDLLGTIYYELDEPQLAIDELQAAIKLEPRQTDHYYKLGMMFLKHRTPEAAIYVFETALKVLPDDHKLWLGLGLSNYIKGDLATAKANLYRALAFQPRDGPTYTVLCDLLTQSHQDEELLSVIGAAIQVQPDDYLLKYYYGRVLGATDSKRAILELQQSIQLNDQFPLSYYELGKVLAQTGNTSAAIDALQRAIALNPNLLEAHYRLGELYRRGGQQALAEPQFAAVKRIQQDGSSDEMVRQLLFTIAK